MQEHFQILILNIFHEVYSYKQVGFTKQLKVVVKRSFQPHESSICGQD